MDYHCDEAMDLVDRIRGIISGVSVCVILHCARPIRTRMLR